jgi:hypothetical protein
LYVTWREIHSLPLRILETHERVLDSARVNFGAALVRGGPEVFEEHVVQPVRSEGIGNLQSDRPWATVLDWWIFLEGVNTAAASLQSTSRTAKGVTVP